MIRDLLLCGDAQKYKTFIFWGEQVSYSAANRRAIKAEIFDQSPSHKGPCLYFSSDII